MNCIRTYCHHTCPSQPRLAHPPHTHSNASLVHILPASATSGVLCVALHRDAAARACHAFRERRAQKSYLAIVKGVVDAAAIPWREEALVGWGEGAAESDETRSGVVRGRGSAKKARAVQYLPAHVFFGRKKVIGSIY